LDAEIESLNAAGIATEIVTKTKAGDEAMASGRGTAAAELFGEAGALQLRVNKDYSRSRFVSSQLIESLEIKRQTALAAELTALCAGRVGLLTGHITERSNKMPRRLNAWVKTRGFAEADGEKGIHGLRFLFGAYITNRKSLYTASRFLGHASQSTTEKHYADLMLDESLYACWETAPSWVPTVEAGSTAPASAPSA
jgi:integrase